MGSPLLTGETTEAELGKVNTRRNYHAKGLEIVPRISEEIRYYPLEIEEMVRAGTFLAPPSGKYQVDISGDRTQGPLSSQGSQNVDDQDAPIEFIEQHRWWDLDGDGYPEPLVVTFHKSTGFVARIVARFDADGVHVNLRTGEITKIDPWHALQNMTSSRILMAESMAWDLASSFARSM